MDETQAFEPFDADETRVLRRDDAFSDADDSPASPSEGHPPYRDRHGPTDER